MSSIRPISLAVLCLCSQQALMAQTRGADTVLEAVTVEASADASAQGLSKPFAGGQVATGARQAPPGTALQAQLAQGSLDLVVTQPRLL
jgi:iron complex outermembrane receptor protein